MVVLAALPGGLAVAKANAGPATVAAKRHGLRPVAAAAVVTVRLALGLAPTRPTTMRPTVDEVVLPPAPVVTRPPATVVVGVGPSTTALASNVVRVPVTKAMATPAMDATALAVALALTEGTVEMAGQGPVVLPTNTNGLRPDVVPSTVEVLPATDVAPRPTLETVAQALGPAVVTASPLDEAPAAPEVLGRLVVGPVPGALAQDGVDDAPSPGLGQSPTLAAGLTREGPAAADPTRPPDTVTASRLPVDEDAFDAFPEVGAQAPTDVPSHAAPNGVAETRRPDATAVLAPNAARPTTPTAGPPAMATHVRPTVATVTEAVVAPVVAVEMETTRGARTVLLTLGLDAPAVRA